MRAVGDVAYTGEQTAKGAGGIVRARVELHLAHGGGLGLDHGLVKLLLRLGAQLLRLVLGVVDDGKGAVQLRPGLVRRRLAVPRREASRHGRGCVSGAALDGVHGRVVGHHSFRVRKKEDRE